jgi:hypothetical protein
MGKLILLVIIFTLTGCAKFAVDLLGLGGAVEGAAGATTAVELAETVDTAKTVGDIGSYANTGKTLTDHAISKYTGKDCKTINILEDKEICEEVNAVDK